MQAVDRPLLIIFEDLHWADPTTGEFLAALVRRIDGLAALAIFTCRPHWSPRLKGAHIERRELQRLPREPALGLVDHIAGAGRMPRAVLEQVVARADGVPLFIEELTRAVLGLGLLNGEGGPAALAGAPARAGHSLDAAGFADGAARPARAGQVRGAAGQRHRARVQLPAARRRSRPCLRIGCAGDCGRWRKPGSSTPRTRPSARSTSSSTCWCRRSPTRRCCAADGTSSTRRSRRCWKSGSRSRRATRPSCSRTTGPRRATPSAPSPAGSPPASAPASARSTARRSVTCARASSWWSSCPTPSSGATRSWRSCSRSGRC